MYRLVRGAGIVIGQQHPDAADHGTGAVAHG
jgi:hypothetical protein